MITCWRVAMCALVLAATVAAGANAQGFGQNKVQYKDLAWSVIETKHFRVYFYEGERAAAMDAARMAERAYTRLSTILRHQIEQKVPLVLYASHADFQSTNVMTGLIHEGTGGVTEFLKRRVTLPFTGGYGDLDHVLTHELVHAFQLDILYGQGPRGLSNPFGIYQPPLWFMEGMCEYLSVTKVDNLTEMWLRDAALQGYLIDLETLDLVGDIRVYRFGQSIFAYMGATFGDDRIGELLKRVARTRNLDRAFRDVLGMTVEKFSKDWMEDVRRTYLPQIRDHKKPEECARRLTDGQKSLSTFHLAPALSPAGDRMVFLSDRSLYIDLYLASALDGRIDRRLVKGDRREAFESLRFLNASFDFSPDGETLVCAAKVGGSDAIYLLQAEDGRTLDRLRFPLDGIANPSFSPDGGSIVFVGLDGGRSDLFRCDLEGGSFERLTDDRYLALSPRYLPDGRSIVFVTDQGEGTDFENLIFSHTRLAILDLETRAVHLLPGMSGMNTSPQVFPDGTRLLYVSDRTGIANLYIRDLSSGRDAQITDLLSGVTGVVPLAPALSLSRDGRRCVFSAFGSGTWDLFAIKDPITLAKFGDGAAIDTTGIATALPFGGQDSLSTAVLRRTDVVIEKAEIAGGGGGERTAPVDAVEPAGTPREAAGTVAWLDSLVAAPDTLNMRPRPVDLTASPDSSGGPDPPPRVGDVFALHKELPDTTGFKIDRYRLSFSVDYAQANGFFASNVGVAAQTYLQFSDVLGDHNLLIGADVYGDLSDSDLIVQYANLANRINYGIALFQVREDFFLSTAESTDEFVSQIYRGGELALSRPFSRFRRVDLTLEGLRVSETVYRQSYYGPDYIAFDPAEKSELYFVRPGIALVHDNALNGSTGAIAGARSYLGVDVSLGDIQASRWIVDRRSYWNVRQRYALALRTIGATSHGRDPQVFRIGGPFTLRGFDYGELSGSNVGLLNLEFRFPLIEVLQLGWPLPLGMRGVRGALFFDAGAAWRDHELFRAFRTTKGRFGLDDIRASYGLSVAWNVGFAVLRWDLAQRTDFRENIDDPRGVFTIGSGF
ncbi:MAG: hypothetical protein FJY88_04780 [Candidatus Eisenbacteria bacterium]|nr:hypothetical protein [Candidatus Eisenbacteria bacterium]